MSKKTTINLTDGTTLTGRVNYCTVTHVELVDASGAYHWIDRELIA